MSENIYNFLKNQKQIQLKSQGKSMLPLLQPNDILYFKKISFQKVKINDLVMVRKRRQIFTHRVIYRTNHYLVTKRDTEKLPLREWNSFTHRSIDYSGSIFKIIYS